MAAADVMGVRSLYLTEIEEQPEKKEEPYVPEENWIRQNEGNWI